MKLIVAVDQSWGIGKDGDQMVYIPEDLKRFQALTTGKAVILGRKTLATFPGGRPLKNRRNLILSRNPAFSAPGAEVFSQMQDLLEAAPEDAFVIGGASVYASLLYACDVAYVTKLDRAYPADCWFPNLDADKQWHRIEQSERKEYKSVGFWYVTYVRK